STYGTRSPTAFITSADLALARAKARGHQKVTTYPREIGSSFSSKKFTGPNGAPHERSFECVERSNHACRWHPPFLRRHPPGPDRSRAVQGGRPCQDLRDRSGSQSRAVPSEGSAQGS